MSANEQGTEAPIENGPSIITVPGQDGHVPEAAAVVEAPKVEAAPKIEAAGSEEDENRNSKGGRKPDLQSRIDELTRARREAERDAEYWKVRAQGSAAPAQAADTNKPPTRDQYASDEAYVEALTDHKVDQKLADKLAARDTQQAQAKASETKANSWQSKLAAARTEIPDFDTVMNSNEAPVAAHVAELIMESDHGAKVAHHFASNPEALAKLNDMSAAKVAFEIGKLEAKFEAASSSKPAAVVKEVSKAPPPAARTVGSGRSTTVALGDLSTEDYIAERRAQGASWAR